MTIDHGTSFWGYSNPYTPDTASFDGQQIAVRIGRVKPIDREFAGNPYDPFIPANTTLRPYVFPWTVASDDWGISYPAGLVGVVTSLAVSGAGSWNAQYQAAWESGDGGLVLVPAVLPVGYTARRVREWHSSAQSVERIRTATGFTDQEWMPSTTPLGSVVVSGDSYGGPQQVVKNTVSYQRGPGNRRVQMRCAVQLPSTGSWSGSIAFTLSHNADGSLPGLAGGDTTDGTISFTAADFVNSDYPNIWTDWHDMGPAQANSIGTMTYFSVTIDPSIPAFPAAGWLTVFGVPVELRLSPRVDVPYPFTATGRGDLIAPGGLP